MIGPAQELYRACPESPAPVVPQMQLKKKKILALSVRALRMSITDLDAIPDPAKKVASFVAVFTPTPISTKVSSSFFVISVSSVETFSIYLAVSSR